MKQAQSAREFFHLLKTLDENELRNLYSTCTDKIRKQVTAGWFQSRFNKSINIEQLSLFN